MAKRKSSKKSKPEFYTILTARFTEPDKKNKIRIELDIKHGRDEKSQHTEKFVGNLRKVKDKPTKK